jgi:hypothetical protein
LIGGSRQFEKEYTMLTRTLLALSLAAAAGSNAQTLYNTLTPEEEASGYTLLFNGTNLTGWRGWNSVNPPGSWAVVAETTWNVIRNGSGSALPLITADSTFQNFDLKVEYYVPSAGNSGIFIRYNQYGRDSWGGASGPETQIAATNNSDGSSTLHRNGTCYDMFGLLPQATNWDRPGGTLNYNRYHQLRIVAFNNRIAHYGNGIKLLEYDMNSTLYNTRYNASKYVTYPIYRTVHQGGIYLQHHGEQNVRFRNMRIKRLTQSPWAEGSPYLINPADSTSGLRDSMTLNDNFFPVVSIERRAGAPNRLNARIIRASDGISVVLDRPGDFSVRVDDLAGRNVFARSFRNGEPIVLPVTAFTGASRVVSVSPVSGTVMFRQVVAPTP